jgi:nitroimidazol reductase NimA-like FMN-containing flavoprotein (pyridoxamine 5'-phosphate oxidase superfamily)
VTAVSPRTAVRRHPERGVYEREAIEGILDEAVICHVGFVVDGQPVVIPTIHARVGGLLYLHGSPANRMLRALGTGVDVCVAATLLDGVVLARSVFQSSLNYRSVVVVGRASTVEDGNEKRVALAAVVEHVAPGRSADARPPSDEELTATTVLALSIHEASAKVRTGPPGDFDRDLELPIWAGVIPLSLAAGTPETESRVPPGVEVPAYTTDYRRGAGEPPEAGREANVEI